VARLPRNIYQLDLIGAFYEEVDVIVVCIVTLTKLFIKNVVMLINITIEILIAVHYLL